MTWIIGTIKIIIVLGTLITIHELGHFLVAKAFNVKVHKFAIGFGPKIFTKKSKETEYTLRLIPFGGFVQLEGEERRSDDERAFNKKKVWQRILVIVAGAMVNIVFALVIYFGISVSINEYSASQIININEKMEAYEMGLRENDTIIKVNNKNTLTRRHVTEAIANSKTDMINFVVKRDGEIININTTIPEETIGAIGVGFSDTNEVIYVFKNSPAEKAGMVLGDIVISIDDIINANVEQIVGRIRTRAEIPVNLVIDRDGEIINISATPKEEISRKLMVDYKVINPGIFENMYYAIDETGYYFNETIKGISKLFIGDTENVELMGPVGIAKEISGTEAVAQFFYLMSAISLSLGIFNLLPIPALDGGRIVLLIIEGIRRKPLKEKTEMVLQLVGFTFIIILAVVITFSDIVKIF